MQCEQCGAALPDGTPECPECGLKFFVPPAVLEPAVPEPAATPSATSASSGEPVSPAEPDVPVEVPADAGPEAQPGDAVPKKKRRVGRILAILGGVLVVLAAAAAAAIYLLPAPAPRPAGMPPAYAPVKVDTSFTETGTPAGADADKAAAETAVVVFYETINAGDFAAVSALVTSDTASAVDAGAFEGWDPTTFAVVRSAIESDTALVFGHESRRAFGSKTLGVKFTLRRSGTGWLIETWQAVDEGIVSGAMPSTGQGSGATALTATTARDLVGALLQARQTGDADTIRLLTTAKFQKDNGAAWLDGVDNSPYFTAFTIRSVKKRGAAYIVTVREDWNSGAETATYTIIETGGAVLADAWTSKQ